MSKIIVLYGISGSGKSVYAHRLWKNNPNKFTIINRDKIRELLFGFNEQSINEYYSDKNIQFEKEVSKYQNSLIYESLTSGKIPILDSTHLKLKYIKEYEYWNVDLEIVEFNESLEICIERDKNRVRSVGEDVIKNQLLNFLKLRIDLESYSFSPVIFENDKSKKPCVILDLDGTLAINKNRNPYEWDKVDEDEVNESVLRLVKQITDEIIICSGRDEICLEKSIKWLEKFEVNYSNIYFRKGFDVRPDWEVKEEFWKEISKNYYISFMIDDRLQVVRRARSLGLKVFNIEYHNF